MVSLYMVSDRELMDLRDKYYAMELELMDKISIIEAQINTTTDEEKKIEWSYDLLPLALESLVIMDKVTMLQWLGETKPILDKGNQFLINQMKNLEDLELRGVQNDDHQIKTLRKKLLQDKAKVESFAAQSVISVKKQMQIFERNTHALKVYFLKQQSIINKQKIRIEELTLELKKNNK